jgi:AraC-like DNA-binding protein
LRVQLKNTTKTIKEIARDLNFPNQSFLGKFFREHVGISPLRYRRQ